VDIEVGPIVEIGGVGVEVQHGPEVDTHLSGRGYLGEYTVGQATIKIRSDLAPTETMATFIHEAFHAGNESYCGGTLSEAQVQGMAQCASQLLRQWGIYLVLAKGGE
jgi:hypothetical protein